MDKETRILLVNAIHPEVEVEARYPHLGLCYLASAVRKNLPDAHIVCKVADRDIPRVADTFCPHLVGISSVSQNFVIAKKYADYFFARGIPVVMGGVHISCVPESLPESALAACVKEGERSFTGIVKALIEGSLCPSALSRIDGIIFRENGKLCRTREAAPVTQADSILRPARDLVPIKSHTYMFTSRGCPFRCSFCASSRFWGPLRFFSANYVVDEIEMLVRDYGVSMISFFDDLFVADRSRLESILRLLETRSLLGKLRFTCSCRADIVDRELAGLLVRMGVVSVGMGLESGNDETLKFLKGGAASVEKNAQAIRVLKSAGIFVNGSFVIGSPRETKEQIIETYDFIRHSALDLFDVYLLTPFPGTPVWAYAKDRGLVSDEMDWSRLDVNAYRVPPEKVISLSETLPAGCLIALYKKFRRLRFFRNTVKIMGHPMRADILKIGAGMAREYVAGMCGGVRKANCR